MHRFLCWACNGFHGEGSCSSCCNLAVCRSIHPSTHYMLFLSLMRRRLTSASAPSPSPAHVPSSSPSLSVADCHWHETKLLLGCIAFRLLNALLLQTFFNPDEYWQSTEVAHRIVFGYGHLTWEWTQGIRSYMHPLIFASLYKVLKLSKLDTSWLVMRAPRLFQALFAAVGDYYLFKLAKTFWGETAARWTIFCQLSNWFTFFCMVRTFSNSLETVLTIVALYYWFDTKAISKESFLFPFTTRQVALFLAAFACVIRPTSAILWIYVGFIELLETKKKVYLLFEVLVIGAIMLGASCIVDKWMYGRWILTPMNFLKFNFLSAGGDYYGTHPWHWYFSQGLPVMILTFAPLTLLGIWWSGQWKVSGIIGWVLSMYSLLGHKEFRFVLPILPLALMFAGYALTYIQQFDSERRHSETAEILKGGKRINKFEGRKYGWCPLIIMSLLLTNIPTALYMSLVHQRGNEAVMHYLSKEIDAGHIKSVVFLMACHSTPYYSFLHVNIKMRFLDCSPSEEVGYVDESDRFLAAPETFVSDMFRDKSQLPSHFIFFDTLEKTLLPFLHGNGYEKVAKIFNAHFAVDHHGLQQYVLVYRLADSTDGLNLYP